MYQLQKQLHQARGQHLAKASDLHGQDY